MKNKTKQLIFALGLVPVLTIFMSLNSCAGATDKEKETPSNEATEALDEANKEYIEQYEAFKNESNSKISENEKAIAVLKSEMKSKNNEVKADLEEKLTVLEEKNEALKEKIRDYKQTGDENWEAFKAEFESDMSNLGEALKDLTKNNVK